MKVVLAYQWLASPLKEVRRCFCKWIAWRIFHYFVGHPYNCVVIALRHFGFCRFHQIFRSRSICCPQGIHGSLIRVRMKRKFKKTTFSPVVSESHSTDPPLPYLKKTNKSKTELRKENKGGLRIFSNCLFPFYALSLQLTSKLILLCSPSTYISDWFANGT